MTVCMQTADRRVEAACMLHAYCMDPSWDPGFTCLSRLSFISKLTAGVQRQQVTAFYRILPKNRNLYEIYCNAPKSITVIREA